MMKLDMASFLFVVLAVQQQQVAAFAPPQGHAAPLPPLCAYHFGQTAERPPNNNKSMVNAQTKKSTSYIPTGLTEEQYRAIKEADAAKFQNVDFGAWGPRWKKVDGDPQGNWFSMPGLWTGGYSKRALGGERSFLAGRSGDGDGVDLGRCKKALVACLLALRRYGLAYFMLFVSSTYLTLHKQLTTKWIAARMLLPLLAIRSLHVVAKRIPERMVWLRENAVTKLAALVTLLAVVTFSLR
ncbi:hypothetical protein HJC23_007800 [Cyclotella cryptica]|uniref:Uncharacterized protein n=1 Tax=Cyclotella cryptica TaxID=29204 RepID=A0ABD3QZP4_9STRA|eukprot:CCRYP_000083-RA/>CCRYP_000083-RA protein AED:0.18 eAED:0.18 QI:0/-1/0/1/-1/1/1/0/239